MRAIECKSGNRYYVENDFTGEVTSSFTNPRTDGFPMEDILEIVGEYVKFQRVENNAAMQALGLED